MRAPGQPDRLREAECGEDIKDELLAREYVIAVNGGMCIRVCLSTVAWKLPVAGGTPHCMQPLRVADTSSLRGGGSYAYCDMGHF